MDPRLYNDVHQASIAAKLAKRQSDDNREAILAMLSALNRLTGVVEHLIQNDTVAAAAQINGVQEAILSAVNILSETSNG